MKLPQNVTSAQHCCPVIVAQQQSTLATTALCCRAGFCSCGMVRLVKARQTMKARKTIRNLRTVTSPHHSIEPCRDEIVRLHMEIGKERSEEHTSELQSHSDLVCRL